MVRIVNGTKSLVITMNTSDTTPALERLAVCSSAVRLWFFHNGLQLNADKSEVVILGTGHQPRAAANITTVEVTCSFLNDLNRWVSPLIPTSCSITTPITLRGHASTSLAPYVT